MVKSRSKNYGEKIWKSKNTLDICEMDLTQIQFHQHPKRQLIESSPHQLIYKSTYINDALAAIEIEIEGDADYGLLKSSANPI